MRGFRERKRKLKEVRSIFIDRRGMDFPMIARTSSSFFAFPVTKVTGRETTTFAAMLEIPLLLAFSFFSLFCLLYSPCFSKEFIQTLISEENEESLRN